MGPEPEGSADRRQASEFSAAQPPVDAAASPRLLDELLPASVHYSAVDAEADPDLRTS